MTAQDYPKVGHYVDFKDRDQFWQVGLILAKNDHLVKIRNQGWPQKYDEVIPIADDPSIFKSSKIQPFRTLVRGCTGQKKNPGSREHWKFSKQDHEDRLKKLEMYLQNYQQKTPEQLIQFFRGEHYFYIEFLMSNNYTDMEDLNKVYQYFFQHINLVNLYLNRILTKNLTSSFINTKNIAKQDQIWDKTFDNSYYEIIEGMYNIAGLQDRLQCFTRSNEQLIKQIVGIFEKHQYYIFHQIQNSKLLQSMIQIIVQTYNSILKTPNGSRIPFAFCFSLFQLFQIVDQIFTLEKDKDHGKQLFQILAVVVKYAFDNLQPNDTAQIQIDRQIQHVLYHIRPLSIKYGQETKYFVWPQKMRMKIAMLYLRCDKLDKKIKGVNKLKDMAQKAVKQQYWSFSQQMYSEHFYQIKCLEELFVQNQHIQMYKKSIEYINMLYKFDMLAVEDLCFVWHTTINKHGALVTILYQFWIEMAYSIQIQDLQTFAKVVIESVNNVKTQNSQFQEFIFDLILAIINNTQKTSQSKKKQTEQIDKILKLLEEMISIGYKMLLKQVNQPYVSVLISKFSNIVVQSHNSQQLLQQIYLNLSKKEEFRVCLQILNDFYVNQEKLDIFVPQGLKIKLIECTKNSEITLMEAGYILTIINSICNLGIKNSLKSQQLLNLWVYFTSSKADFKNLFFDWLLPFRNQQILDNNFCPGINSSLNYDLKRFFLDQIFDNPQYINYVSVSKKEVSIILQLIIEVNLHEQKLQKKRFYQYHNKHLYRIRQIELTNQNILWKVFQSCKQVDVIQYICKYLIRFYLFFSPSLSYQFRKSRIDSIMEKLIKDIKDGFGNNNLRLMKSSLLLLKHIFEYVKEDERSYYMNEEPSLYKVKLQVRFENNSYKLELPQNQTVLHLKQRFAQRLKIKPHEFKMICQEQDHIQELDYSYKNVAISAIKRNLIEITKIQETQQSIYNFIMSYIDIQTQNLLIDMLQNMAVSEEVYYLLDELDLKLNKQATISKINAILQKYSQYDLSTIQAQIFYHLLEIKIYFKLFQKENDIFQVITSKALDKILNGMNYPIKQKNQLHFIYRATSFVSKIVKKIQKNTASALNLTAYLFQTVFRIANWQLEHKRLYQKTIREMQIKIVQHCNDLIQHLEGQENMINFYVRQPSFSQLIQNIYLNYELEQIRMLFTEKLTKYLSNHYRTTTILSENVERYLLHLFIDQMYFKIKQKEMQRPITQREEESVVLFSYVLSTLIKSIAQERFDDTQIIKPVFGRTSSLFDACNQFFQSLRLFSTSDFDWNCLLCAHFNILMAIYKQKPTLIQSEMITFVLQNCLALGNKQQKQPLCKKFEPIAQAFKFLQELLSINKDIQNIKLFIETLQSCHQVEIWRNPINWNISVKKEAKQNFRGLLNPGCICYMNSLLQQLFMIKQFRISILDVEVTHPSRMEEQRADQQQEIDNKTGLQENNEISSDVTMLQGLKELFLKMLYSQQNNINPTSFARTLKTIDKKSMIKINQQMDIDQFEGILFQKLEKGLGQLNYRNIIKELFGGVYSHQIISKECSHKSQRQEQFISMSLQVKQNIVKSFQSLVKSQLLDGVNKYHCEKCDKKVKAQKIQTVKKFPPYLILCLKRFEFDYEVDAKIKINDYCQFPQQLNLLSFSQQEIIKNESQMENQDEALTKLPAEHFDYQLKGVVVHTGSADSGHYYSLIDLKGKWFQFNDQEVFPFDLQKLGEEAFGCKSYRYQGKTKNAYLLIYQRKNLNEIPSEFQQTVLNKSENKFSIQKIKNKNRQIRKFEMVFSHQYDELIKKIATNLSQLSRDNTMLTTWFQFYLSYYFLVRTRKETLQYFMVLSKSLEKQISTNAVFCELFLKLFTSPKFIQQYFVYNPMRDKCKILAHMFQLALKKYYEMTKKQDANNNQLIFKVFQSLKAIFICDQPVSELVAVISRFIQHLSFEGDIAFALKIVENFNLQKILLNFEFGLITDKKTKSEYQIHCRSKVNDINFLAPVSFTGKKFNLPNHAQNWKLVSILLKLYNIFLQSPEYSQLQEKDYYLNNMKYFNDYLNEASVQSKIMTHFQDISTYRAVYYFYQALKELKFNYKVFPSIEKALKDYQSIKYRPFFTYLQTAINDPQTPTFEKDKVLSMIQKAYKHNEKYFLEMDIIHQWILRLVSMNEVFLQIFEGKISLIHDIQQRISKNPYPIIADLGKKFKNQNNQRLYNKYLGILVATEIKEYDFNSQRMKRQFFDISNYNFKPTKKYCPPSDRYDIGQQIQFYDLSLSRWKKGRVIENNFGQLTILKDGKDQNHVFFWQDSEKLRPYMGNEQDGQITPSDSDISYSSSSQQYKQPRK